jgi:hypothetical protein
METRIMPQIPLPGVRRDKSRGQLFGLPPRRKVKEARHGLLLTRKSEKLTLSLPLHLDAGQSGQLGCAQIKLPTWQEATHSPREDAARLVSSNLRSSPPVKRWVHWTRLFSRQESAPRSVQRLVNAIGICRQRHPAWNNKNIWHS